MTAMTDLIDAIAEAAADSGCDEIQRRGSALLAVVSLADGRRQTVKLVVHPGAHGPYHLIRCESRICVARDPALIRQALEFNATCNHGALGLNAATDPPVLDLIQEIIACDAESLRKDVVTIVVRRLAEFADELEKRYSKDDVF